jgi:diguanylate cyclase (GGDEF)-like protein
MRPILEGFHPDMKRSRSPRDLWASLLPTLGAATALALAFRTSDPLPDGSVHPALLPLLVLAGAAWAFHRPLPPGATTPGLGVGILPLALLVFGPAPTACLVAAALCLAETGLRLIRRSSAFLNQERRGFLRVLESAGRTVLAALLAGVVWGGWASQRYGVIPRSMAALAAYLLAWFLLEGADRKIRRPDQSVRLTAVLLPLGLDVVGWTIGTGFAVAQPGAGWGVTGFLIGCLALVALEAARNGLLLEKVRLRARDLERLRRASKRMTISTAQEMAAVVDQIRTECGKVVPFHWYQFELLAQGSGFKSWWSGPSGELLVGVPEPDRHPPALPGVHKRAPWQILERQMRADGKVLARVRLWCDPRRVQEEQVELVDHLLPQMTSSVQRCLLDKEAREDPLTGVAVRRVLEKRLHEMHARCMEEGGAMAVILCDLDFFKRINDNFGHPVGDRALIAVAGVLNDLRRESDLCCRYGGEEFVLLLAGAPGEDALAIAERLRRRIEDLEFTVEEQRVPLTLSAGVASFPDLYIKTAAELILFADEALYEAKRQGRNRCLLDLGQGRYLDVDGNVHATDEAPVVPEPPRIFA